MHRSRITDFNLSRLSLKGLRIFLFAAGLILLPHLSWTQDHLEEGNQVLTKRQEDLSQYMDRISQEGILPSSEAGPMEQPGLPAPPAQTAQTTADASSAQPDAAKPEDAAPQEIMVDLDLKDADMKDVARALSRISGKNIIVGDEVKAKVAMRVKGMGWREAMNMILETYGLTLIEKDNYIVITTFEKRRSIEESGDLQTKIVRFNFVNVLDIQKTLTTMLTKRGKMETDARTNSLVITDIPEVLSSIEEVALKLDTETPQVMIEAMMVTVKLNDDEKLGIDWDITHKDVPQREFSQNLGLGGAAGSDYFWNIKYGKTLLPSADLSFTLQLLLEEKRAEILANPRVLTLDNLPATIDLTEQVPYLQQSESTDGSGAQVSSVQFKDVPVKLVVKPHITKDNFIIMQILTEQSYQSGYAAGTTQPIIDSRKAETNVMVRDGETIVIGGLRKKESTDSVQKLPYLGDIPFVGALFRKTVKSKVDTELIIFVTPYIATEGRLGELEKGRLEDLGNDYLLQKEDPSDEDLDSEEDLDIEEE
jgi:type IV pilus assembly protein PilQ